MSSHRISELETTLCEITKSYDGLEKCHSILDSLMYSDTNDAIAGLAPSIRNMIGEALDKITAARNLANIALSEARRE